MYIYCKSFLEILWLTFIIVGAVYAVSYVVELNDRVTTIERRLNNRLFILPDRIPNITIGDNS